MSVSLISNLFHVLICLICLFFFPLPLHLYSSPSSFLHPVEFVLMSCDRPCHLFYFVLSAISLFPLMSPSLHPSLPPLQSRRLISRCFLSVWSTSQKRDYFSLVIFGRASKRRADKNRKLLLFIYLFQRMPTSRNNRSASAPRPRKKP